MTIEAFTSDAASPDARVRLGMVGGGEGAFIGAVHRIAARLDDHYVLQAGALSSTPEKSQRSAKALALPRGYPDYHTMAREEAARGADGIEAVAIVTPNDQHAPVAEAFLEAGIHVICDKPVTTTLEEALHLRSLARERHRLFAVTYNYSGYPMVRHARRMVQDGRLGTLRLVQVEYLQDWLTEALEGTGQKQAAWRTDPRRAGAGGCIGDIGTHAYQLAGFVSGLAPQALCAELSTFVPGRALDDDVRVLLRYAGGARGMLWASQVAPGNENGLRLRIYGSQGGLEWHQEHPNQLKWSPFGQPVQIISRGTGSANADAARVTRLPSGHPEGYLEGFATLYGEIAQAIRAARQGGTPSAEVVFPTIDDGIRGMAFIEAAVRSSAGSGSWVDLP